MQFEFYRGVLSVLKREIRDMKPTKVKGFIFQVFYPIMIPDIAGVSWR